MATDEAKSNAFAILPIRMPAVPSFPHATMHEIRIRRNEPKIPTPNDSRSLYLKNIPTDSTESHFRAVFAHLVGAGRFETILFHDEAQAGLVVDPAHATKMDGMARKRKMMHLEAQERAREDEAARLPTLWTRTLHKSGGTAVVLLADEKSVQLVMKAVAKLPKTKKFPTWGENVADEVPPLGAPWLSAHLQLCRVDKAATQNAVHAFFDAFNRREKEAVEMAKRLRNEPDEDGFVTVTRGGRAAPASRSEAEEAREKMVGKEAKKKLETKDFYRFQHRERRKQEQVALLQRFDEDRRKVDALREKRNKFRPET
ncbi:uncharacterized protein DCS_02102 [Drechmeria coniospora]|uniref:Ribosomal RNA-processing protein 7 n=1 Tax=Drechmeria coniospora TaxID=98403 RepID=A0A151GVB1_DRECN|nr:uncharacterized protein DCS_02102 [Drechmeria coniospora]KYK60962.1 uncharacterized protein DCS_02102 [Drechmeria coniospora]ODA83646.1 hypothetical protein RJ55_02161 [Drechmeria coniospora]